MKDRLSNAHNTPPLRMFGVAFGSVNDLDKVRYDDNDGRA
jgi:hypothetical protein